MEIEFIEKLLAKLEEIRCCIIDVESECEKTNKLLADIDSLCDFYDVLPRNKKKDVAFIVEDVVRKWKFRGVRSGF